MAKTLTNDDIVEAIKTKTVLELSELSKQLQEVFGVSAAPAVMAASTSGAAAAGGEEAAADEAPTSFDVILSAIGDERVKVIKAVREVTTLGLKEAKDLVEAAPSAVKQGVNKEEAEALKGKLEAEGAKVEIKPAA